MENELSKTEQPCTIHSVVHNALIHNDISRCNDYKCPTGAFCARYRQLRFDRENGNTKMSVTDFKGREKNGLCDYFINADVS
jgi:hypothetical protein